MAVAAESQVLKRIVRSEAILNEVGSVCELAVECQTRFNTILRRFTLNLQKRFYFSSFNST